jgi:hypothetical protein
MSPVVQRQEPPQALELEPPGNDFIEHPDWELLLSHCRSVEHAARCDKTRC